MIVGTHWHPKWGYVKPMTDDTMRRFGIEYTRVVREDGATTQVAVRDMIPLSTKDQVQRHIERAS